jgi:hypothetical protein
MMPTPTVGYDLTIGIQTYQGWMGVLASALACVLIAVVLYSVAEDRRNTL